MSFPAGTLVIALCSATLLADSTPPVMLDPNLTVQVAVPSGLSQPIAIAFIGANDFLVLEKGTGRVKRVTNGTLAPDPVLDLPVNSSSERGLISIALHPSFPSVPDVFLRWTESSTGADSTGLTEVPFLGDRIDRFTWNGSQLIAASNVIRLRTLQRDDLPVPGHPGTSQFSPAGNHGGAPIRFGPDGRLYIPIGDQGRRGQLQNLVNGPFTRAPFVDDTFGGPAPDNAHLSSAILRLNADGSTPADNPFFAAGASIGGEVGANIQKIFAYGIRNTFAMAFDPFSSFFWAAENGDDCYSELNRIIPAMNGGWIQMAGPRSRFSDFKWIETNLFGGGMQQTRYPPTRIAYTSTLALSRLFQIPGSVYVDPDFSWRFEVSPTGMAFINGNTLGTENNGTLWIGSGLPFSVVGGNGGSISRFRLTSDRRSVDVSADPRLADRVADNLYRPQKFDGTETESLVVGRGFGTTSDLTFGPDGALYVVSLTDNVIYKITRKP